MELNELIEFLSAMESPEVRIAITDIDGLLRGKLMHREKVINSLENGFGFCDVIFGWDSTDSLYKNDSVTGWNAGFPDAKASIDPSTFKIIPWHQDKPMLLADFRNALPEICPRSLLISQLEKVENLDLSTKFSMEFEWFNFQKADNAVPISDGMFGYSLLRVSQHQEYLKQLFQQLDKANIQLEGLHTETGPGVMEAAINKSTILEAADHAVLFKSAVKEIASQHQITPSFMAKWNSDLPGCSGHMHQSLWKGGKNLFHSSGGQLSEIQQQYLAGLLYTLPYLLPIYAPTINSYKRLVEGSWAPTTVSWGVENRTTAFRVINTSEDQSRIELRVPGADNNPYLSMAAALASGLYGIENELSLDLPETKGNAYANDTLAQLPASLGKAIDQMKTSSLPAELLGERFVDHFIMTREWEIEQHEKAVSDWELKRYFEGI